MDYVLALHPAAPGSIVGFPQNYYLDVGEIMPLLRAVDRGRLDNVKTHLALASD